LSEITFIDVVQTLLSIKLPLCLISETAKWYQPAIPKVRYSKMVWCVLFHQTGLNSS